MPPTVTYVRGERICAACHRALVIADARTQLVLSPSSVKSHGCKAACLPHGAHAGSNGAWQTWSDDLWDLRWQNSRVHDTDKVCAPLAPILNLRNAVLLNVSFSESASSVGVALQRLGEQIRLWCGIGYLGLLHRHLVVQTSANNQSKSNGVTLPPKG